MGTLKEILEHHRPSSNPRAHGMVSIPVQELRELLKAAEKAQRIAKYSVRTTLTPTFRGTFDDFKQVALDSLVRRLHLSLTDSLVELDIRFNQSFYDGGPELTVTANIEVVRPGPST